MLGEAARPSGATNWPAIGEIDIMEGANGRSNVFQTLHCGTAQGGPCNETNGIGTGERACGGCQTGFHRFATEVDRSVSPEQIRFYLDGALTHTIYSNQVDATTWANAVHHGYFLILNVDSVAVYTKGPGAPAPVSNESKIAGPGGKCVDVAGNDTGGNGTAVQHWNCTELKSPGRCLDVTNMGTANFAQLQLWDCSGGGARPDSARRRTRR